MTKYQDLKRLLAARHGIVIYDGQCNFCNASVNFVIQRDPRAIFRFIPIQASLAQQLLVEHKLTVSLDNPESIILINQADNFERSDAILEICRHLNQPWPLLFIFSFIPSAIRDWLYLAIARRRYLIAGKHDSCLLPSADVKARFIGLDSIPLET